MLDRDKLRQDLIRDEGLRLTSYTDTRGYWTIGVGHLLGSSRRMLDITSRECEALLEADIDDAVAMAKRFAPGLFVEHMGDAADPVREARQRVLVNLAFNLGAKLGQFRKFLAAVEREDWAVAASELVDSDWWGQVGRRGPHLRDSLLSSHPPVA